MKIVDSLNDLWVTLNAGGLISPKQETVTLRVDHVIDKAIYVTAGEHSIITYRLNSDVNTKFKSQTVFDLNTKTGEISNIDTSRCDTPKKTSTQSIGRGCADASHMMY